MTLLVAGTDRPPRWANNLTDFYEEKMSALTDARLIVVNGSGHYIHFYDQQLVIESIKEVVFPTFGGDLKKTFRDKGVDSCISQYKKMKTTYPKDWSYEYILNSQGYDALDNKDVQGAIKLFEFNVKMYPNSFNVYNSLGEAYMDAGDKENAIKNYEKSLALNPHNTNAANMLKKLK